MRLPKAFNPKRMSLGNTFSRKKVSTLLSVALLVSIFNVISVETAKAETATIAGRNATLVSPSATTNLTGISVGGLAAGTTYLVAVGLSNAPAGASLKIQTYAGITASYGYTAPGIYASFATVSFYGALADVNSALASLQYISGVATGSPTLKVSASSYTADYALNGYNGHFYTSSTTLGLANATYTSARTAAKGRTYQGQPGYLTTITTSGENDFITNNITNAVSIWIGATDEVTEGQWRWDTSGGSPEAGLRFFNQTGAANCGRTGGSNYTSDGLNYSRWASGEPNDYCSSGEDYAVTNWGGTGASGGTWNDCPDNGCGANRAYVIEFGTNAADGGFVNANSDLASNTFSLLYSSNSTTTYSASTTTPTYGSPVTLTATVTSAATGTVAFKDASSNVLCTTGNLASGTASCSWTPATRATYAVTAFYSGDGSYLASNSAAANVVVSTRPITIKSAAQTATYTGSSVSVSNSFSITSGTLVGSDAITGVTYTYTSTPLSYNSVTAPTNAGRYTITPSAASFSVGSASNYSITYETSRLSITLADEVDNVLTLSSNSHHAYTTIAGANTIQPTSAESFTVAAWVRPTSTCSTRCTIFSREGQMRLTVYLGKISFILYNTSNWNSWTNLTVGDIPVNQWSHIALTRNGTAIKVFLNGFEIASYTQTYIPLANNNTYNTYIGVIHGAAELFVGAIDEVKVWKSDRSSTVATDMNLSDEQASNLAAYWNFNEGSGAIAYNLLPSATSDTDLTITSSSLWNSTLVSDVVTSGPYSVRTFYRTYLTSNDGWKVPAGVSRASALVVAGGGGGGSRVGGGGGGGGYVLQNTVALSPGTYESITVGMGGFGARSYSDPNDYAQGLNGQDSKLSSRYVAAGGGGGGGFLTTPSGQFNGRSGGSGGGASAGSTSGSSGSVGTSIQNSSYGYGQGYRGGSGFGATTGYYPAGGGGGAGSAGGSANGMNEKGVGGAGLIDPLGGTLTCFSSGGGGGVGSLNTQAVVAGTQDLQGSAGGCSGGTTTASAGTKGLNVPKSASANSGSGGGGSGYVGNNTSNVAGGNGGSGIVIIRWITASVPTYTKPTNAYLNVGMTETFTTNVAVDSATAQLTRTFTWESSTAGAAGPFTLIKSGTGAANAAFSWVPSDTSTSGSNYLYRLTVTDSDTAGLFITDSSTAFAVINQALLVSGTSSIKKAINVSRNENFTISQGTPGYTYSLSPVISGITLDTSTAGVAVLRIADTATVGTFIETLTVTDSVSASVSIPISITISAPPQLTNTGEIVTEGQVFNLDFSNSASYSPITQAIADISGAKKTITAPNGGTYSNDFSGIYTLSSTSSQYLTATAFSMLPKWTIETYIRINQTPTAQFCPFASEYASSSISMLLCVDAARTVFTGFFNRVGGLDKWSFKRSAETIPLNTWVHIVGTFDGSAANLYFDGISTTANSADGGRYDAGYVPPTPNTNRVFIGKDYPTAVGTTPNISLGFVRAYSSGFTQIQAQQNFNATKTRFESSNQSQIKPTQKYGTFTFESFTATSGSDTKTVTLTIGNRAGITWDTVSTPGVVSLSVQESLTVGTYYDTITVTDNLGQSTYLPLSFTVTKADTITVTLNSPSALNYTGSTAIFSSSLSFSGLVGSDTATASSVTITQTRAGNTCAMGGTCSIGDRGPGGGIVFITPSTASGNGKYFEAAPDAWYGTNDLSSVGKFCTAASSRDNTDEGATQYGIGWGETNTAIFMANCTGGAVKLATDYRGGGFSDWFVPSANELDEMRANYSTVDLIKVSGYWGYWSSSENSASVMKSLDNSGSWVMGAVNKSDSTHNMIRPVRMFTPCNEVDSCTAFASTTMPTNAGTYRLTPSALSLSSGDLSNYQGVTYESGLLTINKVSQNSITIGQYDAYPGVSTYPLNVYGGSGTGVMRRTLTSAGTASCELTNIMFLTATSPGICDVRVTKAADFNYLAAEATATIYWIQFQTNYSNGAAGGATGITLTGETAIEKRSYETFTVLSFADETGTAVTSIRANTKLRVIGTGFVAADGTTEVYFGMASVPHSGLTFNTLDPMANYVLLTVPADAETDRVLMYSAKGWATSPGTLTILP